MSDEPRVALVTGGSRGIGAAICRALAADGHAVAINYFSRAEAARALADEITAAGGRALAVPGDVSKSAEVAALTDQIARELGPATILINNAALTDSHKPWFEISEDEWDTMMAVNLKSCFLCFRALYPGMKSAGWGRVVNISSVHGLRASPFKSAYVAAKHGLEGLSKVVALEGAAHGVTSNCVNPAYVRTPLVTDQLADQALIHDLTEAEVLDQVLLEPVAVKRLIEPAEVAELVALLCGPASASLTGSSLVLDGGWTAH